MIDPDNGADVAAPVTANVPADRGSDAPTDRPAGSRPSPPRPSPTLRARRTAAAAVASDGASTRRPSPGAAVLPTVEPAVAASQELPSSPDLADPADVLNQAQADQGGDGAAQPAAGPEPVAHVRRRARSWLVAVLVALIAGLAALNWWLLTAKDGASATQQREQVLSSAKAAVPLILSYNYGSFDKSVGAAKAVLTGRASTDYVQAMAGTIKPTATKTKAVVQAQTDAAGVESVSGDGKQVTVVVFGEQKVTNTSLTAPRTDLFRVRVTMDKVNGKWLVSKFVQI
ncbi:MAG: Mce-associated rane protein [Pseudonocardiales bacterium]|nr:Mce-associated rane protein [Pseudonocardiales bacterium]